MNNTTRVNNNANCRPSVIMMCTFLYCNKNITLMGDVDDGETAYVGTGSLWEIFVPSPQSYCEFFFLKKILIKLHIYMYNFGIITNLLKSSKYNTNTFFYDPFKIQQVWCSKLPSLHLYWQEYLLHNHSATIKNRRLILCQNLLSIFRFHYPNNILYAEKNHILH